MSAFGSGLRSRYDGVSPSRSQNSLQRHPLSQALFAAQVSLERQRAERSGRVIALMLVSGADVLTHLPRGGREGQLLDLLLSSTRVTDIVGWYETEVVAGVVLTEFGRCEIHQALNCIRTRMIACMQRHAPGRELDSVRIRFTIFPKPVDSGRCETVLDPAFYPELKTLQRPTWREATKRLLDVAGSVSAVMAFSPVFTLIAIAIRITSHGPALYRQERIGQFGVPFTMYKFRTMKFKARPDVHQQYMKEFIEGRTNREDQAGLYKIYNDPRVTWLGRFLRKASLDELPQFLNVLRGDMSLVGPRPPLRYEIEAYEAWHRRRLFEAKPGLTGLWQVTGRSRTRFDEMVRLDLRYARKQSVWLDLELLFRTMRVLISDQGAR